MTMHAALWLLAMVALAGLSWRARRWLRERAHREFRDLVFRTPDGPVPGARMEVVKKVLHPGLSALGEREGTAFYYCKGPGPSYFLAVRELRKPHGEGKGGWIVRPLEPGRLSEALVGDEEALQRAFGDGGDRLRG